MYTRTCSYVPKIFWETISCPTLQLLFLKHLNLWCKSSTNSVESMIPYLINFWWSHKDSPLHYHGLQQPLRTWAEQSVREWPYFCLSTSRYRVLLISSPCASLVVHWWSAIYSELQVLEKKDGWTLWGFWQMKVCQYPISGLIVCIGNKTVHYKYPLVVHSTSCHTESFRPHWKFPTTLKGDEVDQAS